MYRQCLNISQMQHLKELGADTSKASMVLLVKDPYDDVLEWDEEIFGFNEEEKSFEYYDAETGNYDHSYRKECGVFTLQDILDLLPATVDDDYRLYIDKGLVLWTVGYVDAVSEEVYEDFRERDLIDAAYEMLCWVVENGYLKDYL